MNLLGILSVIFAQGLFNLNPIILKSNNSPFIYKLIFSNLTLVIPSFIFLYLNDKNYFNDLKILLINKNTILSSICYFLYTILFFYSQKVLPITISLPLFMLYPFLILILNRLINLDKINIGELIGGFITIIGIFLLSNSPIKNKPTNYVLKLLICIFSGFLCAFSYTLLKTNKNRKIFNTDSNKIKDFENKQSTIFNIHINMLLLNSIPFLLFLPFFIYNKLTSKNNKINKMLFDGNSNIISLIKLFIIVFIIQYFSGLSLYYGYNTLKPDIYSAVLNVSVIFAFIYGNYFYNEEINYHKIVSCLIILFGIFINIYSAGKIKNSRNYFFIER